MHSCACIPQRPRPPPLPHLSPDADQTSACHETGELAFFLKLHIYIGPYVLPASLHTKPGIAQGPQTTQPTSHHVVRHSSRPYKKHYSLPAHSPRSKHVGNKNTQIFTVIPYANLDSTLCMLMTECVHQFCVELPLKLASGYWIQACASSACNEN